MRTIEHAIDDRRCVDRIDHTGVNILDCGHRHDTPVDDRLVGDDDNT